MEQQPGTPVATDAGGGAKAFVPSDNTTLTSILAGLDADGYTGHFTAEPGARLRCDRCAATSDATTFAVEAIRRLEGASEPDEMMSVVIARCPACGESGTAVLGYGPAASEEDADVSTALSPPPTARM